MTTLIRHPLDPFRADVLRGEVSPFAGEVVEPVCIYCGGTGEWIGGDEIHVCWCQQDADR